MIRVLVTGSSGLIGTAVVARLSCSGFNVETLDQRGNPDWKGDLTDESFFQRIDWSRYDGIIHLAAVSRVVVAQSDPLLTWRTNVEAVVNVLNALENRRKTPWFLFGSSREVYGESQALPVREHAPLNPINYYGYSKAFVEVFLSSIPRESVRCQVLRFSNVYGGTNDHLDRVVPNFLRSAMCGTPLRLEGKDNLFDFTHLDDVAHAVQLVVEKLVDGKPLPTKLHIVTGVPTTLSDLSMAVEQAAGRKVRTIEVSGRNFDVSSFCGSTELLEEALDWKPTVLLAEGLRRLRNDFRQLNEKHWHP